MRTALIHHAGVSFDGDGLARWLASFSELAGILTLEEPRSRVFVRARHELARSGPLGLLDTVAFRLYYNLRRRGADLAWEAATLAELQRRWPPVPDSATRLVSASPNSPEAISFLAGLRPDLVIARCKILLRPEAFSIPRLGTFVLHPGIVPEYRNAHGCFWALSRGDTDRVGMTLLRIDESVDTGPVYGYFSYPYDEAAESHAVIQRRVVVENLDAVRARLEAIAAGTTAPIDTSGRASAVWGQPRLSAYVRWRRRVGKAGR